MGLIQPLAIWRDNLPLPNDNLQLTNNNFDTSSSSLSSSSLTPSSSISKMEQDINIYLYKACLQTCIALNDECLMDVFPKDLLIESNDEFNGNTKDEEKEKEQEKEQEREQQQQHQYQQQHEEVNVVEALDNDCKLSRQIVQSQTLLQKHQPPITTTIPS